MRWGMVSRGNSQNSRRDDTRRDKTGRDEGKILSRGIYGLSHVLFLSQPHFSSSHSLSSPVLCGSRLPHLCDHTATRTRREKRREDERKSTGGKSHPRLRIPAWQRRSRRVFTHEREGGGFCRGRTNKAGENASGSGRQRGGNALFEACRFRMITFPCPSLCLFFLIVFFLLCLVPCVIWSVVDMSESHTF